VSRSDWHQEPDVGIGISLACALVAGICALCSVFTPMGPLLWVLAAVAVTAAVGAIATCR